MNALEKLKLSKELRGLLGGMDGLKAMEKLKAAKRVRELVSLLGGGESKERSEYPFGKLDESDSYQFNGYRVRVLPGAGGMGDPWEGEVVDVRNHGRLVDVLKDGMAPGSLSIRVSGDRIVVLSAPKGNESAVNGSAPKLVGVPSQQQEAKPYKPEPYAGPRDVSSRAGQMELAQRAGTIASLKAMNSQLRQIAPSEAWDDRAIEEADDLDGVRDMISNALVAAARSAQAWPFATADAQTPSNPLYQSVIDGAEINVSLIEQVIEEANKNGDDETNGQLVQAIDVIKAWAREQGMPDEAFDSLFDSLYNEDYEPFYYTDRMLLIDGL